MDTTPNRLPDWLSDWGVTVAVDGGGYGGSNALGGADRHGGFGGDYAVVVTGVAGVGGVTIGITYTVGVAGVAGVNIGITYTVGAAGVAGVTFGITVTVDVAVGVAGVAGVTIGVTVTGGNLTGDSITDTLSDAQHILQIRAAIFALRGADGDEDDFTVRHGGGQIGAESQPVGGAIIMHQRFQTGLVNRDFPGG